MKSHSCEASLNADKTEYQLQATDASCNIWLKKVTIKSGKKRTEWALKRKWLLALEKCKLKTKGRKNKSQKKWGQERTLEKLRENQEEGCTRRARARWCFFSSSCSLAMVSSALCRSSRSRTASASVHQPETEALSESGWDDIHVHPQHPREQFGWVKQALRKCCLGKIGLKDRLRQLHYCSLLTWACG